MRKTKIYCRTWGPAMGQSLPARTSHCRPKNIQKSKMAACVHYLEKIKTIFVKLFDKNELFIWIVSSYLLDWLFRISTAKWSCRTWGPAIWKSLPDLVNFCRPCPRTGGLSHGLKAYSCRSYFPYLQTGPPDEEFSAGSTTAPRWRHWHSSQSAVIQGEKL